MRNDEKTYGKASNSYGKIGKLVLNHQIPIGKGEKTYDKPSDSYEKRWETYGKPSDSYEGTWGNHAKTIRFLWEKVRQLVENGQVPMEKKENPW